MEYLSVIDRKTQELFKLADTVWENPEILFREHKSSAALQEYLEANGFEIERNVADLPTARAEHTERTGGKYEPAMPRDVMPRLTK